MRRNISFFKDFKLKHLIPKIFNKSKPSGRKVLSVLVEKMYLEMKRLKSISTFEENTGSILLNLLNTSDLISVVRECSWNSVLGVSSGSEGSRREDQIFPQGSSNFVGPPATFSGPQSLLEALHVCWTWLPNLG